MNKDETMYFCARVECEVKSCPQNIANFTTEYGYIVSCFDYWGKREECPKDKPKMPKKWEFITDADTDN